MKTLTRKQSVRRVHSIRPMPYWSSALLLLLVLVAVVPVHSGAAGGAGLVTEGTPSGITASRTLHLTEIPEQSIPLVQLFDPAEPGRSALTAYWSLDESGWFPTWRLELSSETGLISTGGSIRMGTATPAIGRTYEVALSYKYATGAVAFVVYDVDDAKPVLYYNGRIESSAVPLRVAGDAAQQADVYQPVALRWDTLVGPADARGFSTIADSYADPVWVRVVSEEAEEGTLNLLATTDQGELRMPLGTVDAGENIYALPDAALPLGGSQLRLQYVMHGEPVWESHPKLFRVGKVTGSIKETTLQADGQSVDVALELRSAEALDGVQFDVRATLYSVTWDVRLGGYLEALEATHEVSAEHAGTDAAGNVVIRAQIPLPDEKRTWRVHLALRGTPDVATQLVEANFRLSTATGTMTEGAPGSMRICSYNILGFEGYPMQPTLSYLGGIDDIRRVNHYAHVLRTMDCDIIGIQEGHSVEMLKRIAQTWNRNLVAFPSASRFPGGIFTSYPVLETRTFNHAGPANQSEPFSRFAGAALLDIKGNLTWVVNLHAWPHEEAMREREAEIIARHIAQMLTVTPNMIVLGDFNSRVGGPFDRALREIGLVNVMGLNWIGIQPTVVGGQAAIDHIYVSGNLVEFVQSGRIHSGTGFDSSNPLGSGEWFNSDHLPVVVELMWP